MSNEEDSGVNLDEDRVLAFTRDTRKRIVQELLKDNKVPGDQGDRSLLVSALDGLDRSAIATKRIASDSKVANGMAGAASMVASLLSQMSFGKPGINPTAVSPNRGLGKDIPDPVLVPGETDLVTPQLNYDSFMNATDPHKKSDS